MSISSIVVPEGPSIFFSNRMKQKSCIEEISQFSNHRRKPLPFFLTTHNSIDVDQDRLALRVKDRLAIKQMMDCLDSLNGVVTFSG